MFKTETGFYAELANDAGMCVSRPLLRLFEEDTHNDLRPDNLQLDEGDDP